MRVSGSRQVQGSGKNQPEKLKMQPAGCVAAAAAAVLQKVGGESFLLLVLPVHNQCKRREVGWICHCAVLCKHGGRIMYNDMWEHGEFVALNFIERSPEPSENEHRTSLTLMNCVYNYCCTMTWNPIMVSRHSSWHAMVLRHIA